MKRQFLAFAALTAAAGAMAQSSSVTLFGVADVSVGHVSTAGKSVSGLASGGSASSRLGFRGEEDLGAGLKAGFWLEGGLDPDDGNAEGFGFDRRSTLSLSGAFGELRLGRDKTPTFLNMEHFHPFADAGLGAVNGHNLIDDSAAGTPDGSNPKRVSNSVSYLLPKMDGVYGQLTHSFGEQADDSRLSSSTAVRLGYAAGALDVGAAYGSVRGGTAAAGVNYRNFNIGASYKLGAFTPMLLVASERGDGSRVDLYSVGLKMALGQGELRAAYSMFEDKNRGDADSQRLALGYGYQLSKRTEVYTTVAHMRNDALAARALDSSLSRTPNAGRKVTGYEIGLRHNF
ncbi:porin [Comamonas endophytica]|uniref:Porin n=1 Tax=Comamonas endophytica TaxID=2949090 RepID=A0ABY6GA07_9BURK|nr:MULTISPECIES: porin [unclassified Acidovorax]MCD2511677.1 porin [Acidovorax sp. D4N7]UYG51407.1 porin [Acidovorax sp. 5MLIR]